MIMKIDIAGEDDRVYDQFQLETVLREHEQIERRQAAENERLDVDDQRTYCRLRGEHPILEPDLPLDEMTMRDYNLARDKETGGRR